MRRQLVTVRRPGASNAPIKSTCACRQTRSENNGAKVFRRATNSGGKDSKQDHFRGHLHTTVPSRNGQSRAKIAHSSGVIFPKKLCGFFVHPAAPPTAILSI